MQALHRATTWRSRAPLYQEGPDGMPMAAGPFSIHKREDGYGVFLGAEKHLAAFDTLVAARTNMYERVDALDAMPREYVYFIGGELRRGRLIKIGRARNVDARLRQLQTGSPVKLHIFAAVEGDRIDEARFHVRFAKHREHGEWFKLTDSMVRIIRALPVEYSRPSGERG